MPIVCDLKIPVPIYVEKFLYKKYGTEHKLNRYSTIGALIIQIATTRYMKPIKVDLETTGCFTLLLSKAMFDKKVYQLPKKKLSLLSDMLNMLFYEEMAEHLRLRIENNNESNAKKILQEYLSCYDITEDDLKLETAYMQYRRRKKKLI